MRSRFTLPSPGAIFAAIALLIVVAAGCASPAVPTPGPTAPPPPAANTKTITPILATTQLRVGSQRVAFLLVTSQSLIKAPTAKVVSVFLGEGAVPGEEKTAGFHLWPYGVRGAYSTELTFERAGPWRLEIEVESPEGLAHTQLDLQVAEAVSVPEIGSLPPLGLSKTIHSVSGLEELTSDFTPDLDLYQMSIAEAIISGMPTVVVFATPAFCTSATCGPQVDTVSELKELHLGKANFIHVELYDNPHEIQGDLSKGKFHSLVHEWGLSEIPHWFNESWTFLLGANGRIAQRFEGFVTLEELDQALRHELSDS